MSCSKKDVTDNDITITNTKLQGKWVFVNFITNSHYSNMDHITTTTGSNGDFMNFSTNQQLYVRLLGFDDTFTYSVLKNSRVLLNGVDTFDLKTLNENQLVLYRHNVYSASSYKEETYNLIK